MLVALSFAFRLPVLANAPGDTNSDMAVVGLQASRLFHGHFSWFLPGSGYQTSVDSMIAAAWFAVFGAGPLVLILSALVDHVIAMLFAYATLRRHVTRSLAALLVLPLVFTPPVVHMYALHPPRQAALTLVFAAIWLLDSGKFARGTAVGLLAAFADPYALVFLPSLAMLGVLTARRTALRPKPYAVPAAAVLGGAPFVLLHLSGHASTGQIELDFHRLHHNLALLLDRCLPWATSATAYYTPVWSTYVAWPSGALWRAVQWSGAVVLIGGAASGLLLARWRKTPRSLSPLGVAGALIVPVTLGGFLFSVMVMDLCSARYLASLVLLLPFALAPLARALSTRRFALLLLPYLASAAFAGWVGYWPLARGLHITRIGAGDDERHLEQLLAARGVHDATGDYWAAYRLTFITNQRLIVVPNHTSEDRIAGFRERFRRASHVAYIYDRFRSGESFAKLEKAMAARHAKRVDTGIYTAFIYDTPVRPSEPRKQARIPKRALPRRTPKHPT